MGSGAFLVQVCRYLSERLFEAWHKAEEQGKFINSEGNVSDQPIAEPMTKLVDDRMNAARRLIAEKCLYGVDINPLAVELAKLSIWLVTISKGRPFGFLDHNLKSGDSLLGIHDIEQLRELKMKPDGKGYTHLFGSGITGAVDEALRLREEIRQVPIRDITDVERMSKLHDDAQLQLSKVKLLADLFIGEVFSFKGKANKLQERLDSLSIIVSEILQNDDTQNRHFYAEARQKLDLDLPLGKPHRRPFHWALEFPEVFQSGGFDAICGNPPFSGGQHLTGSLGTAYRDYLVNQIADGAKGSADLVAYFYLNAYDLLKNGGVFGLIACNTIAEGDTRQVGLERLLKQSATIIAADPNMPWPGTAAVVISPVFIVKNIPWHGKYVLSGKEVETISAFLSAQEEWSPKVLKANANQSYIGSYVLGMGFTMSEAEAKAFIERDPKNAEVLFPYLNGDDLNSDPEQKPSRWVINFSDWPLDRTAEGSWSTATEKKKKDYFSSGHVPSDYPACVATDFPDLLAIVREKVKPEREKQNRECRKKYWWHFAEKTSALYHAIGRGTSFAKHPGNWPTELASREVIAVSLVQTYLKFELVKNNSIFAHKLAVILPNSIRFAILSSTIFQEWARKTSSTMGYGINFSPSDSYETFPFPVETSPQSDTLQNLSAGGNLLHITRQAIMLDEKYGLTALYNKFHNPQCESAGVLRMREVQRLIDYAVLEQYKWNGIDLEHGFYALPYLSSSDNVRYTISESARIEILRRLAILNKQRWQEEQETGNDK